jgi:TonB family protein
MRRLGVVLAVLAFVGCKKPEERHLAESSKPAEHAREHAPPIALDDDPPRDPDDLRITPNKSIDPPPPPPPPRAPDDELDDDPNGVVGGDIDDTLTAPPPPPPPPPVPQVVAPTVLEGHRVAGDKDIRPDDRTKAEIEKSGKHRVVGSFKMCITATGKVETVKMLKSTGFPAYDATLIAGIHGWRYRPYLVNGSPKPVCTAVTFVYSVN